MQESEYGSIVVIYIPTILYMYTFIKEHDPILRHQEV